MNYLFMARKASQSSEALAFIVMHRWRNNSPEYRTNLAKYLIVLACCTATIGCDALSGPPTARARPAASGDDEEDHAAIAARRAEYLAAQAASSRRGSLAFADSARDRPENVAEWNAEHLWQARLSGDLRTIAAVPAFAENSVGDDEAAQALAKLLPSAKVLRARLAEEAAEAAESGEKPLPANVRVAPYLKLVAPVIAGLARIDTPSAREALVELLKGDLVTDINDREATRTVLKSMMQQGSPESDKILFQVLTQPEEFRQLLATTDSSTSGGTAQVGAAQLQEEALRQARFHASADLRARLAEHMVESPFAADLQAKFFALFQEPIRENLGAQAMLLSYRLWPSEAESKVARLLADASRRTLEIAWGLPISARSAPAPKRSRAAASRPKSEIEEAESLAEIFWDEAFLQAVSQRVSAVDEVRPAGTLLQLALNLPATDVRRQMLRLFDRQWHVGPQAIQSIPGDVKAVLDPGMLVALKMIARNNMAGNPGSRRNGRLGANVRNDQAWTRTIEAMVQATARRWLAVATEGSPASTEEDTTNDQIPWKLPEDCEVVASTYAELPGQISCEPSCGVGNTSVHFLRGEVRDLPEKIQGHFQRELREAKRRSIEEGAWLSSLETLEDGKRVRSTDVLLKIQGLNNLASFDREVRMTVEILSIEIENPAR